MIGLCRLIASVAQVGVEKLKNYKVLLLINICYIGWIENTSYLIVIRQNDRMRVLTFLYTSMISLNVVIRLPKQRIVLLLGNSSSIRITY